jgi:hypothetical protein
MSLAAALNVLRPTLPYYLALTKCDLLHLDATAFEFRPHPNAPPLALEMAKNISTMGASSCIESYFISVLEEGVLLLPTKGRGPVCHEKSYLELGLGWSRHCSPG